MCTSMGKTRFTLARSWRSFSCQDSLYRGHKAGLRTTPEAQSPAALHRPPTHHSTWSSQPSSHPLSSMRQACWLYTLQSKAPGSSRSQSPSSCRLTSKKSVMVMSSKWAQALSSWYMVGPEPMSIRTRPDTSPGGAEEEITGGSCLGHPAPPTPTLPSTSSG